MNYSEQEFLFLLGWDDFFASQNLEPGSRSFPARVICEERNLYRLQSAEDKTFWAVVSGKLQFNALSRGEFPAVGDWVLVNHEPAAERGIIHRVLPRRTTVYRKQVGSSDDMQILAANVDQVFITTSVGADLNFRRIERYLAVVHESGAKPYILLTKADMAGDDLFEIMAKVQREFSSADVFAISQTEFEKADFLRRLIRPGSTSVFVGSSGVGKSTLVNFLLGSDEIKTQEIRSDVEKGRHTTTSRNLYLSRYGGIVIDTPGMRELQLSDHADGVHAVFSDVEDLILRCRFRDCQHQTEPDCAVLSALANGDLTAERWRAYQKLQAEVRRELRKVDRRILEEDRRKWKKLINTAREKRLKRGSQ